MRRFYCDMPLVTDQSFELPADVFHHWVTVLRASPGDEAVLFTGHGGEFTIRLDVVEKKRARAVPVSFNPVNHTPRRRVIIGQVMSRGDRMDYMIQKATELGVAEIQLLTSERCEERLKYDRDQKKLAHWQSVAVSACEQCGMNIVPIVHAPLALEDWINSIQADHKLVMAPSSVTRNLADMQGRQVALLIGPEGGLSESELKAAEDAGFLPWQLGDRVFRTETAPIVALSLLHGHEWSQPPPS